MVAEVTFAGGSFHAGDPKAALVSLHPAGAAGPVELDWGDGSAVETLAFDGANSPVTASHTFPARGQYAVSAGVDGNTTTRAVYVR